MKSTQMGDDEKTYLLQTTGNVQEDQRDDISDRTSTSRLLWAYSGVFGRKGWLSAAPFFPGPHLSEAGGRSKTETIYFNLRDAVQKTLGFFALQSMSSHLMHYCNEQFADPPGQEFDIRYIVTQQAHANFSFYMQCQNIAVKDPTAIFWLNLFPIGLCVTHLLVRVLFFLLTQGLQMDKKIPIADAYDASNSWKEGLKLYGFQAVEILLANLLINWIALSRGTNEAAVLNEPALINGLKVLIALNLDLLRNGVAKALNTETAQRFLHSLTEKAGCPYPGWRVSPT